MKDILPLYLQSSKPSFDLLQRTTLHPDWIETNRTNINFFHFFLFFFHTIYPEHSLSTLRCSQFPVHFPSSPHPQLLHFPSEIADLIYYTSRVWKTDIDREILDSRDCSSLENLLDNIDCPKWDVFDNLTKETTNILSSRKTVYSDLSIILYAYVAKYHNVFSIITCDYLRHGARKWFWA